MAGHNNWPYIVNLGNSIIGVAILAMPFCFKQCGILLGMLVLLFCTWLTLTSCQLLMRAGIHSRRRSYEFLAYHTHGATGKLLSEIGMIGMQVGTLIAQIVVIGDLGPAIFSKFLGLENTSGLRIFLILALCLGVGLPLGLLKDLRAVSRASTVCISFYCIFILYVIGLSLPNIKTGEWYQSVSFWRPEGFFQCLPILSFSFGCQTQLFLLYDALPEPSLKAISGVISSAVNLCAVAYLLVGFFGYVAFYTIDVPGDVIGVFPNTFLADVMKICFVFSIVITFPVIIFPCRSSIYTLLFAKKSKAHDDVMDSDGYLPERLFRGITIFIVISCMILGILIPNVEFILGINGAIMGTLICYIFPAMFFLKVLGSKQDSRGMAQIVLILGVTIMLVSTMATLNSQGQSEHQPRPVVQQPVDLVQVPALPRDLAEDRQKPVVGGVPEQLLKPLATVPPPVQSNNNEDTRGEVNTDKRQEPPNPDPPDVKPAGVVQEKAKVAAVQDSEAVKSEALDKDSIDMVQNDHPMKDDNRVVLEEVKHVENVVKAADANKAKELELQAKEKKQDELLQQLEKHREEQEKLLQEQRQLLREFKDHHEKDVKNEHDQEKEKLQLQQAQEGKQPVGLQQQPVQDDKVLLPADPQFIRQQQQQQQLAQNQQQQQLVPKQQQQPYPNEQQFVPNQQQLAQNQEQQQQLAQNQEQQQQLAHNQQQQQRSPQDRQLYQNAQQPPVKNDEPAGGTAQKLPLNPEGQFKNQQLPVGVGAQAGMGVGNVAEKQQQLGAGGGRSNLDPVKRGAQPQEPPVKDFGEENVKIPQNEGVANNGLVDSGYHRERAKRSVDGDMKKAESQGNYEKVGAVKHDEAAHDDSQVDGGNVVRMDVPGLGESESSQVENQPERKGNKSQQDKGNRSRHDAERKGKLAEDSEGERTGNNKKRNEEMRRKLKSADQKSD